MSEIDDFEVEIIKEAEEKAKTIILAARNEAEKIINQADEEATQNKNKIADKRLKSTEKLIQRELSKIKIKNNIELSKFKETIIQEVLTSALKNIQRLRESKSKEYSLAIQKQIEQASITLEGGKLNLEIASEDSDLLDIARIEKIVSKKTGVTTLISVNSTNDSLPSGGFILRKGELEVNNSISAILERRSESVRNELHKILFESS
ncbi:MAG: hypothetical protein EAX86_12090 [Candidatus Heimdallarchaeota archaeon]|nr:hypothetical protein [Candidatus Heimdallarchaeota archaeon]